MDVQPKTLIDERVRRTFQRLPHLIAFTLDRELALADVEVVRTWPGHQWSEEVFSAIDDELSALVAELQGEDVTELLRGRTFARTLH